MSRATCRSCAGENLQPFLDLGRTPLADGLLTAGQLTRNEPRYPLEVAFCPDCSLVQILQTVPPEELFQKDYPYYSSFSETLMAHSRANALDLIEQRKLGPSSLVVELASNDGYLLQHFVQKGIPVLGIDPAQGPARAAREVGVPTLCEFFTRELAQRLVDEGKRADVIIANNVLAHVADTNGFVAGIAILLKQDGIATIEFPYLRDLIEHCEFDTIYHEHLCYFSVTSVQKLLHGHGLYLNDVKRLAIHGGSLRLYVGKRQELQDSVRRLLEEERQLGMDGFGYYRDFAKRVQALKQALRELLLGLKMQKKRIAAYGAAAKGSTLLNYTQLGTEVIDFVVDRNIHKQGKFMPGVHIPIDKPERILAEMPDYVLILPWNFKEEILRQQQPYRDRGGRFIIPIPTPQVL